MDPKVIQAHTKLFEKKRLQTYFLKIFTSRLLFLFCIALYILKNKSGKIKSNQI